MFKQISPCMNCTNRAVACWDSCEAFKEWKTALLQDKQKHIDEKSKRKHIEDTMNILRKNMKTRRASSRSRSDK